MEIFKEADLGFLSPHQLFQYNKEAKSELIFSTLTQFR